MKEFYEYCDTKLEAGSRAVMTELIKFEGTCQTLQVIANLLLQSGNVHSVQNSQDRKKYIAKVGLYPERIDKLFNVTDMRGLV